VHELGNESGMVLYLYVYVSPQAKLEEVTFLGHEQWWHTQLVASCKKVIRSNMVNFISPMEATTLVRRKREGTPQT
jgi:hypothetical protein